MKKMKITFISDTHNKHEYLTSKAYNNILGSGDVLVHAGDISMMGKTGEIKSFLDWFSNVDYTHKIFIAGNHDWGFELVSDIAPEYKEKGVHYLFDSGVEIDGVNFWGSPWQPEFFNWAFNLPRGEKLAEKWASIPGNTDILITHGPAHGMLDWVPNGQRVGCEDLFQRIMDIQPKIHVCGHIHSAYGQKSIDGVEFLNASVLDERYEHAHKPIVVNFNTETKEVEGYA